MREPHVHIDTNENGTPNGYFCLYNFGKFGDVYEMSEHDLEVALVVIGDFLNELKGGMRDPEHTREG